MNFHIIIPARLASQRLPGKMLLPLAGKPLVRHAYQRARQSGAQSVTLATDSEQIADAIRAIDGEVQMTDAAHASGTDRIAEAARNLQLDADAVIVNLQGDEAEMPPALLKQVAQLLHDNDAAIATACAPIEDQETLNDPNTVKVVRDTNRRALYFSRAPMPSADRHIGIYAYRNAYLQHFAKLPPCALEQAEKLEQLRALWHGDRVLCCDAVKIPPPGVDTAADLAAAALRLQGRTPMQPSTR